MGTSSFVVIALAFAVGSLVLIVVSAFDVAQHRIPNLITYSALMICLAGAIAGTHLGLTNHVAAALVGGLAFGLLLYAPHHLDPEGMGLGDVKLAVPLGFVIGWTQADVVRTLLTVGWTLAAAAFIGLAMAAGSSLRQGQRLTSGQVVPFGPALSVAALVAVGVALF